MGLSETQEKIAGQIRMLSTGERPFTTAAEIADHASYSKRTVLNNIDAVIEEHDDIGVETVGQANVYFVRQDRMDDIWQDGTRDILRLFGTHGKAEYVELRDAPKDSDFELIAYWYDAEAVELPGYWPNNAELGEAAGVYASEPITIKYHDPRAVDDSEGEDA
jgi:hypothetical protein